MTDKPLLAVTIGDPSGIGPEIVAKSLQNRSMYTLMRPVLIGSVLCVQKALDDINSPDTVIEVASPSDVKAEPGLIEVISPSDWEGTKFPTGEHDAGSGSA